MLTLNVRPPGGDARPARVRPVALAGLVLAAILLVAACGSTTSPPSEPAASGAIVGPSAAPATPPANPTDPPVPTTAPTPSPSPTPTPVPTPVLVPAPLTGVLVPPKLAARHPIAVMVDDQRDARPQSGFTEASVVWQAPAEGGIPRYMLVFAEGDPASVGPVRSSRLYYVQWAAEWKAMYVHVGGSPQALALLRSKGQGQAVFNADEFRWGGTYLWRTRDRFPPHNVYTDGKHLRSLAKRLGATAAPKKAAWVFADDAELADRPAGAKITLTYPYNVIGYRYDRASNTWLRYVGGKPQVDRANKKKVAPKNVVIMTVAFGSLGPHQHGRLEAANIGTGKAWIATNGTITKGTWKKASVNGPTRFFDKAGQPIVFTRGQTFIQVIPPGTPLKLVNGKPVVPASPAPAGSPASSASPAPSASPTP